MTQESINAVLKEIQSRVPKNLLKAVVRESYMVPEVRMVMDKALEDPDFPEEKKKQIRLLQEKGYFNKKVTVEDQAIAKQINNFISREINKAVKEGRLPTKKQLKELNLKLNDKK